MSGPDRGPGGVAGTAGAAESIPGEGRAPSGGAAATSVSPDRLTNDADAWDMFVASTRLAPYLQATPWAEVKARNGWRARRVVAAGAAGPVGCQLLAHPIGPLPWSVGYAPRGPVAAALDEDAVRRWTETVRRAAAEDRLSHVVIDPEIEVGGPELAWFHATGWSPCPSPQPSRSRWIDLGQGEDALWADMRGKWRQYVQKARRGGVSIVDAGAERLSDFYAIYVDTARRAGFTYRSEDTYRAVLEAYGARGRARLLFAVDGRGEPQATLMLLSWGHRIVEPYGGMTRAGAESRANYLLKWEAIRSAREAGFRLYDMWGLSHVGIEHFKTGFGGREVSYIGGLELTIRPAVRRVVEAAQAVRVLRARRRLERERGATADGAEP